MSSRWNPTPEQLRTLEDLYRRGTRTPTADQIQHITAQLRRYGKIEGKNVFYWFQNHKARERQKRRRQIEAAMALERDAESLERKDSGMKPETQFQERDRDGSLFFFFFTFFGLSEEKPKCKKENPSPNVHFPSERSIHNDVTRKERKRDRLVGIEKKSSFSIFFCSFFFSFFFVQL